MDVPKSDNNESNAFAWSFVLGKPSKMNPFAVLFSITTFFQHVYRHLIRNQLTFINVAFGQLT